jgi:hypothetical protein
MDHRETMTCNARRCKKGIFCKNSERFLPYLTIRAIFYPSEKGDERTQANIACRSA